MNTNIEELAASVRSAKRKVSEYKVGYMRGHVTYDELAQAGRELSNAMYKYSRAKFPAVTARRLPYQALIR